MVWRITWLALLLPGTLAAQSLPEQVIERVNQARWEHGQLPPLKNNERLAAAAQAHSDAMATRDFIMHCDPDTRLGFAHRVGSTGYRPGLATENLEAGPESADAVMQAWMSDSGQRFNLLADYREIGVGYRADPNDFSSKRSTSQGESCHADRHLDGYYGHYWTQVFGLLYGSYPVVIAREAWQSASCEVEVYLYAPPGTTQMRLSSDNGVTWSAWQAYTASSLRTLDGEGGGVARVLAESRDANGTVRQASDSIRLVNDCGLVAQNRVFRSGFD